jgi:hypothetical protein
VAPVAQERLKEMALALSVRERPSQAGAPSAAPETDVADADEAGRHEATRRAGAIEDPTPTASEPARAPEAGARAGEPGAAARRDRLVLPRASADQAVQALAIGGLARRRSRVTSWAAAASAADAADRATSRPAPTLDEPGPGPRTVAPQPEHDDEASPAGGDPDGEKSAESADEHHGGNGTSAGSEAPRAKASRRKAKHQGLPEGWVIDDEGFVVPGAG